MDYPKVLVIILNRNGKDDTLECLQSFKEIDYPNYEIVVVDNGSSDGSQRIIKEKFPYVELIENRENLGFSRGNNVAIRYALRKKVDYVLLLNNDTVVHRHLLKELVEVAEISTKIGIVGPKIYYYDNPKTIWFAGGLINLKRGTVRHIGKNENDIGQFDEVKEVDYVTGCALMIKREVIEKIGLLDEDYSPIYYEDTDWGIKAMKKGYKCVYVPKAKLWHKVSSTMGGEMSAPEMYLMTRNLILFVRKHGSAREKITFPFFLFRNYFSTIASLILKRKWDIVRSFFEAIFWHLKIDDYKKP